MNKLKILVAISCVIVAGFAAILGYGFYREYDSVNSIKMRVKEKYQDSINDNISVNKGFKTGTYSVLATTREENITFQIDEETLKNDYIRVYWKIWMQEEADKIIKQSIGKTGYCFKAQLLGEYTENLPNEPVMPYKEYMERYASKENTYIVFKIKGTAEEYTLEKLLPLYIALDESSLIYEDISIFFEKDSNDNAINLTRQEIREIVETHKEAGETVQS